MRGLAYVVIKPGNRAGSQRRTLKKVNIESNTFLLNKMPRFHMHEKAEFSGQRLECVEHGRQSGACLLISGVPSTT